VCSNTLKFWQCFTGSNDFLPPPPQPQENGLQKVGKALKAPMVLSMLSSCCYQLNLLGRGLVLFAEEVDVVVAAFWL
jgi:hypothetical protein